MRGGIFRCREGGNLTLRPCTLPARGAAPCPWPPCSRVEAPCPWPYCPRSAAPCRVVPCEAVDGCICCTRKIQHGGDWERSRPQGPKNVHNFLMTVRPLSWSCGHGSEMLLILKKTVLTWLLPDIFRYDSPKKCPRFCTRSICGWNLF